ncbi:MAG: ABC transporter permease, partial [Gemmatimonadaceae bacterium]
ANVSSALPRVIGVRAVVGRTFIDADEAPGAPASVVLAYSYWRTRFAGDSGIVGRSVMLDGAPHLVLGVLEPRAQLPSHVDLWRLRPLQEMLADTATYMSAAALLAPGATAQSATAELSALGAISEGSGSRSRRVRTLGAAPFPDYLSIESKGALLLLGMIGIVVGLIAATNFAALILARGIRRRGELAIRAALGASTGRLVAFMIAECVLIALAGGALGGVLAPFVVQALGASVALLLPPWMQLTFSLPVVMSAIALALVVGVAFGLAPALELARPAALGILRGNALATQRQRSGRQLLVAVQVALATGPIVFATILFGSLFHFGAPSLGFDQRNLYQGTVQGGGPDATWRTPAASAALLDAVRRAPGVASVAISHMHPLGASEVRASTPSGPATFSDRFAEWNEVTPAFFATFSPTLVAGRLPTEEEVARGEPVAVVNESLLRALSLGRAIGWQLHFRGNVDLTVVGIIADVRQTGFERNPIAQLYSPVTPALKLGGYSETVWVRATPGATRVVAGINDAIRFDPSMAPLADLKSSVEVTNAAGRELRSFIGIMLVIFGVALLLAAIGIYGTIAYAAVMRRKEVAVRLALGASRAHVAGVVMREAAGQALVGLIFGIVGGDLAALSIPNGTN